MLAPPNGHAHSFTSPPTHPSLVYVILFIDIYSWWCYDCTAVGTDSCLESHPAQVLTTAAARTTLLARLIPAAKAAKAANKKLANLQNALDSFEVRSH